VTIGTLIVDRDVAEVVRDQVATILAAEVASQQVLAETVAVAYTRADDSDSTATASADEGATLEVGDYTITAGTLTAGKGTWTAVAPSGAIETCTTTTAGGDLLFPTLGLTLDVTGGASVWDTADVITATVHEPQDWKLRVYLENGNPWAQYQAAPAQDSDDACPIVNVSLNAEQFDKKRSNAVARFGSTTRFHLDCYGYGKSTATDAGHDPGDARAALEARRAVRLVRQILSAGTYTYLGLRGTVGSRWVEDVQRFPPKAEEQFVQNIAAYRLTLAVEFSETSPQVQGVDLETVTVTAKYSETGEVLVTQRFECGD